MSCRVLDSTVWWGRLFVYCGNKCANIIHTTKSTEQPGDRIPVIFRTRPHWPWGPASPLYIGYRVSFPGIKRPGRDADHPSLSSTEVIESVELYLHSPSGISWPVVGWPLPLPLPLPLPGVILAPHTVKTSAFYTETNKLISCWMNIQGDSCQSVTYSVGLHPISYDATFEDLTVIWGDDCGKERLKKEWRQWRTEGEFGVFKPPHRNSEGPPKSCQTQPDCENC